MANRSDFYSAKLPRQFKRILAMEETNGWIKDEHERGNVKRTLIAAHANHVAYKLKRNAIETRDASENE